MRKTKIVCTIGPASSSEEVFAEMCRAGLNVARLNFSHGTHAEHQQKFDMIRKVRRELELPIAIMLDTKGPEYRIRTFKNKKIMLKDGDPFTFTTRQVDGDETIVSVSYAGLANDLSVGDTVLVNNGLVIFEVENIEGTEIHCRVVTGGELSDCKSMSFPHKVLEQVYLSEQDKDDLLFGIQNGIDFVAASFVSRKQDCLMCVICNGRTYGGGFCAGPEAQPDDGWLDVFIVRKVGRLTIAKLLSMYKNGRHFQNGQLVEAAKPYFIYRRAKAVTLRAADGRGPIIATADGECAPCEQVRVEVQPLAGRVWLPKAAYHRFVEQKTAASAE